jgi:membrane fusion protein (multidrug efflux system)
MIKKLMAIIPGLTLLAMLAACGGGSQTVTLDSGAKADTKPADNQPATDETGVGNLAVVREVQTNGEHKAIGSFFAKETVTISAKVGGTLLKMNVDVGDPVSERTLIAQVDQEDYQLGLRNAKAQLAVAQASLNNARGEYNRKKILFDDGAITQSTFDLVKTQLELAEAQLDSAKVAVEMADKSLRDTEVRAGVKGIISERTASAGEFVGPGAELVVVSVVKPIKMKFSVPERLATEICEGDMVNARLAAFPGRIFQGEVKLVSPTIDPATRTVPIEAEFTNEDGALKPGFFADSTITLCSNKQFYLVPQTALFGADSGYEVHVKTSDSFKAVPVILVEVQGNNSLIACENEGDLQSGEQVMLK